MWLLIFVLDSNAEQCQASRRAGVSTGRTQGSRFSVTPLLETLLGEPSTQPDLKGTQNSYVERYRNLGSRSYLLKPGIQAPRSFHSVPPHSRVWPTDQVGPFLRPARGRGLGAASQSPSHSR